MGVKLQINPFICNLDALYCQEERFEEELTDDVDQKKQIEGFDGISRNGTLSFDQDLLWEHGELVSLLEREEQCGVGFEADFEEGGVWGFARKEAVKWIIRVLGHHGFGVLTAVLAVNYFDRFLSSLKFQRDKPWMVQLATVACLSLAAKIDETQVPLLLDLQVDCKYVFEAKTIQRMELLVLSTLKWRMNPVTPLSFVDHIIRRLGLKPRLQWDFLSKCERMVLSLIADPRFGCYLASVIAVATMLYVIEEIEPRNSTEYQNEVMDVLKISKDEINDCYKLMVEINDQNLLRPNKRNNHSVLSSPCGVMDAPFNSENSNDSWNVACSVSSSPEPLFKKTKPPSFTEAHVNAIP